MNFYVVLAVIKSTVLGNRCTSNTGFCFLVIISQLLALTSYTSNNCR